MNQIVRDYYDSNASVEWRRLALPLCKIEFLSTLKLIEKYFPKLGRVCDIGGGSGRYSIELSRRGYSVSLFDLSEAEVAFAGQKFEELGLTVDQLIVGDAQDLSVFESESFDAALLLGPMYHLLEFEQRLAALREMARILKPDGIAIIAYLNSWGLIKSGIADFPSQYQDISTLRQMLGERTFRGHSLSGFTECYWSTPEIAIQEVANAGFSIKSHAGVESFANGLGAQLNQLANENPNAYANVITVAAETCELEQYRNSTDHLCIVVKKPESSKKRLDYHLHQIKLKLDHRPKLKAIG